MIEPRWQNDFFSGRMPRLFSPQEEFFSCLFGPDDSGILQIYSWQKHVHEKRNEMGLRSFWLRSRFFLVSPAMFQLIVLSLGAATFSPKTFAHQAYALKAFIRKTFPSKNRLSRKELIGLIVNCSADIEPKVRNNLMDQHVLYLCECCQARTRRFQQSIVITNWLYPEVLKTFTPLFCL